MVRWMVAATEWLTGAHLYLTLANSGYLLHGSSDGMCNNYKKIERHTVHTIVLWPEMVQPPQAHNHGKYDNGTGSVKTWAT